jgi:hypothetical protein
MGVQWGFESLIALNQMRPLRNFWVSALSARPGIQVMFEVDDG